MERGPETTGRGTACFPRSRSRVVTVAPSVARVATVVLVPRPQCLRPPLRRVFDTAQATGGRELPPVPCPLTSAAAGCRAGLGRAVLAPHTTKRVELRASQAAVAETVAVERPPRARPVRLRRLAWELLLPVVAQTARAGSSLALPGVGTAVAVLAVSASCSGVVTYGTKPVTLRLLPCRVLAHVVQVAPATGAPLLAGAALVQAYGVPCAGAGVPTPHPVPAPHDLQRAVAAPTPQAVAPPIAAEPVVRQTMDPVVGPGAAR